MGEDNCKVEVFGTVRAVTASTEGDTEELDTNQPIRIPFDPVVVRKHLMGDNCNDTDEDKDSNETTATDGVGIAPASHVLFSVPLPRDADPVLESVLESVAEWWGQDEREHEHEHEHEHGVNADNKVLGLLSTTGVYGNHDGGVVTEESELLCSETSNAHLYRSLEDDWIDLTTMTTGKPHRRFCVFRQRRRERESKIVCNQRMRDELLPALAFPTYKEGLEAILNEPETPWQKQLQQQQQRDCDERK
eukprot:jgi/Psemu1/282993/fgenesh1_pg.18_\